MREYHYTVDPDGRVVHDGTEIVDPATLHFFLRAMQRTPEGRWLVVCQGEQNWFEVPDTPFVVRRVRLELEEDRLRAVEFYFVGDVPERRDPATLESDGGMLFCRIRRDAFRARFGRLAMQQLSPFLIEDRGAPALILDGRTYAIREGKTSN